MSSFSESLSFKHSLSRLPHRRFSAVETEAPTIQESTRILIADEHILFRDCLRTLLIQAAGYNVVGEAGDRLSILRMVRELQPDLVLLDWELSQRDGMAALKEISACTPAPRTILMAFPSNVTDVSPAIQLGVTGVLSSETNAKSLCEAISKVMQGQYVIGQEGLASLVHSATDRHPRTAFQRARRKFGITRREFDIISEIVAGYASMEIAEKLSVSSNTLKHHISHIYDKFGVSNRLELVLFVLNHNIVSEEP